MRVQVFAKTRVGSSAFIKQEAPTRTASSDPLQIFETTKVYARGRIALQSFCGCRDRRAAAWLLVRSEDAEQSSEINALWKMWEPNDS
jgi:hypothetical protein